MHNDFKTLKRMDTDSIKWKMAKAKVDSPDVLTFSVADSDYEVAAPIKKALKDRVEHGAFGYTKGDDAYFAIIKDWMKRRYGLGIDPSWIIPIPKVLNGLSVLLQQLTEKNDTIVLQTPVYHAFRPVIEGNGRIIVDNPLTKDESTQTYAMDLAHLEKTFQDGARMLVLCSPHNPVGRVWTKDELKQVVALCKAYDVYLVSDEIHADIIMPGYTFTSIGHFFDDYAKIILLIAPSKTFNIAGLQVGTAVIKDPAIRTQIKNTYKHLHLTTPNLLSIKAHKAAYTECDDWVDAQNEHVWSNYTLLKDTLEKHFDNIKITPLEGTYLAWVDIGFTGMDSKTFTDKLAKEEAVVVAEGRKFKDEDDSHVRINLACSKEQIDEGLTRIIGFLNLANI